MMQVEVNGSNATPIYKFLKSIKGGFFGDSIKWNFTKFLVDNDGNVVDRYKPTTSLLKIEVLENHIFVILSICSMKIALTIFSNWFYLFDDTSYWNNG